VLCEYIGERRAVWESTAAWRQVDARELPSTRSRCTRDQVVIRRAQSSAMSKILRNQGLDVRIVLRSAR
jgi:hypothetical protein